MRRGACYRLFGACLTSGQNTTFGRPPRRFGPARVLSAGTLTRWARKPRLFATLLVFLLNIYWATSMGAPGRTPGTHLGGGCHRAALDAPTWEASPGNCRNAGRPRGPWTSAGASDCTLCRCVGYGAACTPASSSNSARCVRRGLPA